MHDRIGIVIIGRNEGERLRACLQSVAGERVVYVDSGSSDNSVEVALMLGADVIELDMCTPFTASRARNEGFARLRRVSPALDYVQFIDGDSTIDSGWLSAAESFLDQYPTCAAVAGRLREMNRDKTIYNRLCDIEWNVPPGNTDSCGGIAMFRITALLDAGTFDPRVSAGEEPELCVRLRQKSWTIHRLACDMGHHDADMTRFSQWWRRTVRGGYAFALGAHMHGRAPQRHWVREVRSNWLWGLALPLLALGLAWPTAGWSLLLLAAYPLLAARITRRMLQRGYCLADAWLYARFCVLAKFANVQGQLRFHRLRVAKPPAPLVPFEKPLTAGNS